MECVDLLAAQLLDHGLDTAAPMPTQAPTGSMPLSLEITAILARLPWSPGRKP